MQFLVPVLPRTIWATGAAAPVALVAPAPLCSTLERVERGSRCTYRLDLKTRVVFGPCALMVVLCRPSVFLPHKKINIRS